MMMMKIKKKKNLKIKNKKIITLLKKKKIYNLKNFLLKDYFLSLLYYKNTFVIHSRELVRYKKFKNRLFKLRQKFKKYYNLYNRNSLKQNNKKFNSFSLNFWFSKIRWLKFQIFYYFEKIFMRDMYNRFFKPRNISRFNTYSLEKYNIYCRLNKVLHLSIKFNSKNKKIFNNFEYLFKYKKFFKHEILENSVKNCKLKKYPFFKSKFNNVKRGLVSVNNNLLQDTKLKLNVLSQRRRKLKYILHIKENE